MSKTTARSIQLASNLFLVEVERATDAPPAPPAPPSIDHYFLCDVSGSMSMDLPRIREHLKEKIARLIGEDDTLTLIWFSGKNEFGPIVEHMKVPGPKELETARKLFDRWLVPVGLTGFVNPLKLCKTIINKKPKGARKQSLTFLSDGCENQSSKDEVWSAIEALKGDLDAATVVQYGYYADKNMLCEMAARLSGNIVFAEDFVQYEPIFEAAIKSKEMSPTEPVKLPTPAVKNLAWTPSSADKKVLVSTVGSGNVTNVRGNEPVYYLSEKKVGEVWNGELKDIGALESIYGALSVYAERMDGLIVDQILRGLGDVSFIEESAGLFGKQKYAAFAARATEAAFDDGKQMVKGHDPNFMPKEDAFTVLDVLALLQEDPEARLLLDHPSFRYSKISRGREDASGNKLAFVADKQEEGYPVLDLVWNSQRANLSLLVKKTGKVNLSGLLPESKAPDAVPMDFPTFIYRNFSIVADGLVNIDVLPIRCSKSTVDKLAAEGVKHSDLIALAHGIYQMQVRLKGMPVLNKKNVVETRAADLGMLAFQLQEARAGQKVWKHYKEAIDKKRSAAFDETYGKEASDWLKTVGITSYGGYAPSATKQVEATDFYMSKVVDVGVKGLMTLPSVKDIETAVDSRKPLKGAAAMMEAHVRKFQGIKADADKVVTARLMAETYVKETRGLLRALARQVFSFIVGQRGFSDVALVDDKAAFDLSSLVKKGPKADITIEMKEVKVEL